MNHTEVIRSAMSATGTTQKDIANKIGVKSQSVVSERINYKTIGLKPFLEILDALGYEVVVRESANEYKDGEYPIRLSDYE